MEIETKVVYGSEYDKLKEKLLIAVQALKFYEKGNHLLFESTAERQSHCDPIGHKAREALKELGVE